MDPITILGVAGNIVQFVDFALKIVSKGNRIYHSADGSAAEHADLDLVTNDLLVLQTKMQKSLPQPDPNTAPNEDDEALRKLLNASSSVATALLGCLNTVKVQGRWRRWNSLRQAVKSVCCKAEVDEMASRLSMFRDELQTRVLISLSSRIAESNKYLQKDLKDLQSKCDSISGKVENISARVLISNVTPLNGDFTSLESLPRHVNPSRVAFNDILNDNGTPVTNNEIHKAILMAFEYKCMEMRHEAIPEAHAKTFHWILEEDKSDGSWDNFVKWLKSSNSLYWLKGKAASGKSTLMKYLIHQKAVKENLQTWAGACKLIQADFFFWALGTPLQKSQAGLLMSLIRKILMKDRSLTRLVLPALWDCLQSMRRLEVGSLNISWKDWTLSELIAMMEKILVQALDTKICLFVDGLDEYSGNHADLAAFFSRLSKRGNVKICVSGRPLPALEYEFIGCPGLQLQDLTRNDIQAYVYDKLSGHRHFMVTLRNNQAEASKLIEKVVENSCGVFLWVYLVTRSLVEGFTNRDTLQDLMRRLNDLPMELDALYRSMLRSISPPFYKAQAAMLLQIVCLYGTPISALALSFADEPDWELAMTAKTSPIPRHEADARIEAITHRLKSRCCGLIEVQSYGYKGESPSMVDYPPRPDQIQYLHLTVKEFLEQPEVWTEIQSWLANSGFNANMACLRGTVLLIKKTVAFHGWGEHIWSLLSDATTFIRNIEQDGLQDSRGLLEEIDQVGDAVFPSNGADIHWSVAFSNKAWNDSIFQSSYRKLALAGYAIMNGLVQFVEAVDNDLLGELNRKLELPLLINAIGDPNRSKAMFRKEARNCDNLYMQLPSLSSTFDQWNNPDSSWFREILASSKSYDIPYLPMIKILLDKGFDPNEPRNCTTPWLHLVKTVQKRVSELPNTQSITPSVASDLGRLIDTMKLFILYGADLDCFISLSGEPDSVTAPIALHKILKPIPRRFSADLLDMVEKRTSLTRQEAATTQKEENHCLSLEERIISPKRKRKGNTHGYENCRKKRGVKRIS